MELGVNRRVLSSNVRRLLLVDAAFEAIVGAVLLGLIGSPHRWLDVSLLATLVASGVFFVAAIALAAAWISRSTSSSFVRQLAFANVAGGAVLWMFELLAWRRFQSEGHWFVAAVADSFILLGVLEFLALRRSQD